MIEDDCFTLLLGRVLCKRSCHLFAAAGRFLFVAGLLYCLSSIFIDNHLIYCLVFGDMLWTIFDPGPLKDILFSILFFIFCFYCFIVFCFFLILYIPDIDKGIRLIK